MVTRNRNRIKITYLLFNEILLHIAHHLQGKLGGEDAGVLGLVFLQYIGLYSAANGGKRLTALQCFIKTSFGNTWSPLMPNRLPKPRPLLPPLANRRCNAGSFCDYCDFEDFLNLCPPPLSPALFVPGCTFSHSWSMAAFIKKARSMGAGPLMVMLTEVFASHKSKPLYKFFCARQRWQY